MEIARDRIEKAAKGQLRTRPLNKPVYEPSHEPRRVKEIGEEQE